VARTNGRDIVEVLQDDHALLRSLAGDVSTGMDEGRAEPFLEFRDLILRHQIAEDLVVYPALVRFAGGAAVADSRQHDQTGIEAHLTHLDHLQWDTPEFELGVSRLLLDFLGHIQKEEAEVLPILATKLGRHRRADLGERFMGVMQVAPLHRVPAGARPPSGPTIVDHTAALSVWVRDVAVASGLAG
jgi:Hemerythrin HHE cation binding domain